MDPAVLSGAVNYPPRESHGPAFTGPFHLSLTTIWSVSPTTSPFKPGEAPHGRETAPTLCLYPMHGSCPTIVCGWLSPQAHWSGLFLQGFLYHKTSLLALGWTGSEHLFSLHCEENRPQHPTQPSTHPKGSGHTTLPHREDGRLFRSLLTAPENHSGDRRRRRVPEAAINWEKPPNLKGQYPLWA